MASGIFTINQVNQAIRQGAWSGYIAPTWVEYLVVAGGGGASVGGGGAGGLLTGIVSITGGTSYTVTVGAGGSGATGSDNATNGSDSLFGSISSTGGGRSKNVATPISGGSGGGASGSGASGTQYFGASGVAGQGNAGGNGSAWLTNTSYSSGGGGGGGAGTVGLNGIANNPPRAGNGGAGIASAISGAVVTYAGGGGGGADSTGTFGVGGVGGGGGGAYTNGGSGSSNSGGGGGGIYGTYTAGAGGSGVVIVRYPGSVQFFTGGTLSYGNGYVIHTFYSSGTLAPTTPTPYIDSTYQISRSLRFNSADSTYLSKTWSGNGSRTTATASLWVKKSSIAAEGRSMAFDSSGSGTIFWLFFNTSDQLQIYVSGSATGLTTTQVFRDPSAWYHIVVAIDTTQATSSDRIKLYVNGSQVTAFTGTQTYYSQNATVQFNNTSYTGYVGYNNSNTPSGYMTEVNWIDGQALTPSSFGYTNPSTGVWSPVKFVGTYGTNGFYLNFSDNSNTTAATLGKDYSGNGNNWTPNNFSVTAGAGNDSLVDSPTSYGTDTGVGGTVRGNYATLNPLNKNANVTFANGNLDLSYATAANIATYSTIGVSSGKWYAEVTWSAATSSTAGIGITLQGYDSPANDVYAGSTAYSYGYDKDGKKYNNGTGSAYGATFTTNDVISVAFDADAGTLTFYKNGTSQGTAFTSIPSGTYLITVDAGGTTTTSGSVNFGQRPFAYTAPSGFKALCTQNLPTPTIGATTATQAGKYFNPVLYTGTGSSQSITGVGFQPDLVWAKIRSGAKDNNLTDAVRGSSKALFSNTTSAEVSGSWVTAFNSDGFTVGTEADANQSGQTFVAWNWKANGSGSSNNAGSITSTVSANTTSGFSIVTYTGTGANATVGHGLGAVPSIIFIKNRTTGSTNWVVYNLNATTNVPSARPMYLNTGNAEIPNADIFNYPSTNTTTVFNIGTNAYVNTSTNNYVAYCFTPIAGYSAMNIFTGNGSADGPFVYCGFRPAYVLIKDTSNNGDWYVWDTSRDTYNVTQYALFPDLASAETSGSANYIDILSNGFKIRATTAGFNSNADKFLFMAFASAPQKFALAR